MYFEISNLYVGPLCHLYTNMTLYDNQGIINLSSLFFRFRVSVSTNSMPMRMTLLHRGNLFFLWNKNKWQSSVPRTTWIVDQHSRSARAPCMQLFSLPPKWASSCLPIYLASCALVLPVDTVKERSNKLTALCLFLSTIANTRRVKLNNAVHISEILTTNNHYSFATLFHFKLLMVHHNSWKVYRHLFLKHATCSSNFWFDPPCVIDRWALVHPLYALNQPSVHDWIT